MTEIGEELSAAAAEAKQVDVLEAAKMVGATLKRAGAAEWVGPCPNCGGEDRFGVNTKQQVFNCRGSGGGDVIQLVRHATGCGFKEAVELLTGTKLDGHEFRGPSREAVKERREETRDRMISQEEAEAKARADKCARSQELWEKHAKPIEGTPAEEYLRRRGITVSEAARAHLRFIPRLPYLGRETKESSEETHLGEFPAMLAAIRDKYGVIIGIHRTYLDPDDPIKLRVKPWQAAKKVFGNVTGGAIWLGDVGPTAAIGEGIESTLSWMMLQESSDAFPVAAVSLGNLSGKSTGTLDHPTQKNRKIPNGIPDMSNPGMELPDEVSDIILLGDCDSDAATTFGHLMTACRRYQRTKANVLVSLPPTGDDWNDVLLREVARA